MRQRACKATNFTNASILDTLALAQHMTGDTASAIETQQRAIQLAPVDDDLKATLARYESALAADPEAGGGNGQ